MVTSGKMILWNGLSVWQGVVDSHRLQELIFFLGENLRAVSFLCVTSSRELEGKRRHFAVEERSHKRQLHAEGVSLGSLSSKERYLHESARKELSWLEEQQPANRTHWATLGLTWDLIKVIDRWSGSNSSCGLFHRWIPKYFLETFHAAFQIMSADLRHRSGTAGTRASHHRFVAPHHQKTDVSIYFFLGCFFGCFISSRRQFCPGEPGVAAAGTSARSCFSGLTVSRRGRRLDRLQPSLSVMSSHASL